MTDKQNTDISVLNPSLKIAGMQLLLFLILPVFLNLILALLFVRPCLSAYQYLSLGFLSFGVGFGILVSIIPVLAFYNLIWKAFSVVGGAEKDSKEHKNKVTTARSFPIYLAIFNFIIGIISFPILYFLVWLFVGISTNQLLLLVILSYSTLPAFAFFSYLFCQRILKPFYITLGQKGFISSPVKRITIEKKVVYAVLVTVLGTAIATSVITFAKVTQYTEGVTLSILNSLMETGATSAEDVISLAKLENAQVYYVNAAGVLENVDTDYDDSNKKLISISGYNTGLSFNIYGPTTVRRDVVVIEDEIYDSVLLGKVGAYAGPITEKSFIVLNDRYGETVLVVVPGTSLFTSSSPFPFILLGTILVFLVISIIIARIVARSVANPINELDTAMSVIATGKYPQIESYYTLDEIESLSRNLQLTVEGLKALVDQTTSAIYDLESTGIELNSTVHQQASSANSQASAITETSATLSELSRTVGQTAAKADDILAISDNAIDVSENSRDLIHSNVTEIRTIDESMHRLGEVARSLSSYVERIDEIADIVENFAEQTSILSINAAIEAGRAGDEGLGFAAVAREIKVIAESFQKAADETESIVEYAYKLSNEIIQSVTINAENVHSLRSHVEKTGSYVDDVVVRIRDVGEMANSIAGSARQQSQAIDQAATAIGEISIAAAQNAASSDETKAATQNLTEISKNIRNAVERYK